MNAENSVYPDVQNSELFYAISIVYLETNYVQIYITEWSRHLWRSSGPTSLLKQGHLEQVARTMLRWLLNISKEGDSTTPVGNLCQ